MLTLIWYILVLDLTIWNVYCEVCLITLGRTPLGQVGILGRRVRSAGAAQAFQATTLAVVWGAPKQMQLAFGL